MTERILAIVLPLLAALALLAFWEWAVDAWQIRRFVLPAPSAIGAVFVSDGGALATAALVTLQTTLAAFLIASVLGIALGGLLVWLRPLDWTIGPFAVVLQVTPVVAIAPLIVVWVGLDRAWLAVLILAVIVAFFPVFSAARFGLTAADANLKDLFKLYGAGPWSTFWRLRLPAALPYLFTGLKSALALSLVGTVVAEFAAASGSSGGLAWRILEAGNRLQIARMFACLALLAFMGMALTALINLAERAALGRWHDSAR